MSWVCRKAAKESKKADWILTCIFGAFAALREIFALIRNPKSEIR